MLVQAHPQLFLWARMSRGLPKEPHACCCCATVVSGSAGERFLLSCVLLAALRISKNAEQRPIAGFPMSISGLFRRLLHLCLHLAWLQEPKAL